MKSFLTLAKNTFEGELHNQRHCKSGVKAGGTLSRFLQNEMILSQ